MLNKLLLLCFPSLIASTAFDIRASLVLKQTVGAMDGSNVCFFLLTGGDMASSALCNSSRPFNSV